MVYVLGEKIFDVNFRNFQKYIYFFKKKGVGVVAIPLLNITEDK